MIFLRLFFFCVLLASTFQASETKILPSGVSNTHPSSKWVGSVDPIFDHYEGFVSDIHGVIHDRERLLEGAREFLLKVSKQHKKIVFITNSTYSAKVECKTFREIVGSGDEVILDLITPENIFTAGDFLCQQALSHQGVFQTSGLYFHLDDERNSHKAIEGGLEAAEFKTTSSMGEAQFILVTLVLQGEGCEQEEDDWSCVLKRPCQDFGSYESFLTQARMLNIPLIAANGDGVAMREGRRLFCPGKFIEFYQKELGGIAKSFGKPNPDFYQKARGSLGVQGNTLVLGDTLKTDMRGAMMCSLPGLLLTGPKLGLADTPWVASALKSFLEQESPPHYGGCFYYTDHL